MENLKYPTPITEAEVNTQVDIALTDYDASTTPQVAALNNVSQAEVNAQCDIALTDYDASTGTEVAALSTQLTVAAAAVTAQITALRGGVATVQQAYDEAWETEHHVHNYERWFGKSANQAGDNWGTESSLVVFAASSNAGDFGTAIKVLGATDTPNQTGMVTFDLHRVLITDLSANVPFILRIIQDIDGDGVANTAEGKGYYTDVMVIPGDTNTNRAGGFPTTIIDKRDASGAKVWAKAKAAGTVTVEFFVGLHEYTA